MFACREHWAMVPAWLQATLWRAYREGQEVDKRPSPFYRLAQLRCRLEIARRARSGEQPALFCRTRLDERLEHELAEVLRSLLVTESPDRSQSDEWLIARMDLAFMEDSPPQEDRIVDHDETFEV